MSDRIATHFHRVTEDSFRSSGNNFLIARLLLASSVIFSHSYWAVEKIENADPFSFLIGKTVSSYAVDGFFFLSGILVYASLLRRQSLLNFLVARAARIWPALAASVLATVAIGLLLTKVDIATYFTGPTASFIVKNLALQSGAYSLTGVECGGEICNVNGSLWTIAWEVRCYMLLAFLFAIGLASEERMKQLILPGSLAFAAIWHLVPEGLLPHGIEYNLNMVDRLWTMFALGIAAYIFKDRILLSWPAAVVLFLGAVVEAQLPIYLHLDAIFIAYFVLCTGILTARKSARTAGWPDYSYGMYIYAFPVMMLLNVAFQFESFLVLAALNVALTLPIAVLSWHYIEKPALSFWNGWLSKRNPSTQA